jgi:histidinol phosphatase-like enzyme (inositol monophosphatase family)
MIVSARRPIKAEVSGIEVSFDALSACAHKLADASGAAIRPHFRKRLVVEDKGGAAGFDPVTVADKAAERAIIKELKSIFPDHGVIGEEYGVQRSDARFCWVIDPIDGTRAFMTGMPTWGTLIGLYDGGVPLLGLMDQPVTGERCWTSRSGTYFRMGSAKPTRLKTRACSDLKAAVFTSTHPDLFATLRERAILTAISSQARLTRYGGDCYAYCQLAAGNIDLIVEPGLKVYDIAALIPIIERAGGCVTTWDGGSANQGGDIIATGDPALHEQVIKLMGRL